MNIFYFIHSVVCLTTGPQTLTERVLHTLCSSDSSFNFQHPLISFRSSSSCLHLLPCLSITSIPPPISPSIMCFRSQFLCKCDQFNKPSFFLLYVGYSSPPWLHLMFPHYSHSCSNWSSPSFSSTAFQTFPGIFHLPSKVSKFQHHKMPCSNCSTLLVSSLHLRTTAHSS